MAAVELPAVFGGLQSPPSQQTFFDARPGAAITPQPPGPDLPCQAPSVKISIGASFVFRFALRRVPAAMRWQAQGRGKLWRPVLRGVDSVTFWRRAIQAVEIHLPADYAAHQKPAQ